MNAKQIVQAHLRELEKGNWDKALEYISDDYVATGMIPFLISLFIKLKKKDALTMHIARKRALPDFKFNEEFLEEEPDHVKMQMNLTGTHDGLIDYTGILRGIPVVQPTHKKVKLNPEFFDYYVRDGKIYKVIGNIPKNAGVKGLVKAVTGEEK